MKSTDSLRGQLRKIVTRNGNSVRIPEILEAELDDLVALYRAQSKKDEIGWQVELPDLPYFQIKAFDGHSENLPSWVSPLYRTKDLPAILKPLKDSTDGMEK